MVKDSAGKRHYKVSVRLLRILPNEYYYVINEALHIHYVITYIGSAS